MRCSAVIVLLEKTSVSINQSSTFVLLRCLSLQHRGGYLSPSVYLFVCLLAIPHVKNNGHLWKFYQRCQSLVS